MRRVGLTVCTTVIGGLIAAVAYAQLPLTSDLINFAGGGVAVASPPDPATGAGDESPMRLGIIMWTARESATLPLSLTLTSRGLRQILFFDPAPLIDVAASDAEPSSEPRCSSERLTPYRRTTRPPAGRRLPRRCGGRYGRRCAHLI